MDNPAPLSIAARNKKNYLEAKQAFNENRIDDCVLFYAPGHEIKSRPSEKGRQEIRKFFENLHVTWPGLRIDVEHAVAEDDWVMGHSRTTATHSNPHFPDEPLNWPASNPFEP